MIEARIDLDELRKVQHNVLHAIEFIRVLREAGVPVIGTIVMNGVERGELVIRRENDLDEDISIVSWYDEGEYPSMPPGPKIDWGAGRGYSWVRFKHPLRDERPAASKSDPDDWDEDEL